MGVSSRSTSPRSDVEARIEVEAVPAEQSVLWAARLRLSLAEMLDSLDDRTVPAVVDVYVTSDVL